MRRRASHTAWRTFCWPLVIAAASIAGLLSALLGDGWEDALSWLLLGGVLAVIAIAYARGERRQGPSDGDRSGPSPRP